MGDTGVPSNGKGGIVTSVVTSFKLRPDFLAILVLNVVFLGILYFSVEHSREIASKERMEMLNRCFPTREEKN